MKTDVLVVGAGPAGLLTSIFINNHDVLVIEEHSDVGLPKHCAGFVSKDTAELMTSITKKDIVDNKYRSLVFYIGSRRYELVFKEYFVYRINRPLLEQRLLDKVYSRNHKVLFNTRGKPTSNLNKVLTKNGDIDCSKIVVADGPNSVFRRFYVRDYVGRLIGVQYLYRACCLNADVIHILYSKYTPDFFQWLAPIDKDVVLIGFATRKYSIHPDFIVEKIAQTTSTRLGSRLEVFGGVIPLDKPLNKPILKNKLFFIGDSIPAVKPYTGGGLLNIFLLAPALGYSIDRGEYSVFNRIYSYVRARIIYEYLAVGIFRKIGYWIPPRVVYTMYKWNTLKPSDYDNQYSLLSRALKFTPHILLDIILERINK